MEISVIPDHLHVLEPGEEGFEEASELWNTRFQRRPDVVVECRNPDDVVAAVDHARREGLALGVKGGGHSYPAATVPDSGILLDLGPMKTIEVDAKARRAVVGAGVTCGELDRATQGHGLATPLPTVSSVGVVGAALGGGSGWLSRLYGLTLDNIISAEVVTADGRQLHVSDRDHPDLFWGLRGAGANLGVVTSLTLRLHPVGPEVLTGQIIYPFQRADELLRAYREFMAEAPRELQCYPFMFRVPPIDLFPSQFHGQPVLDFVVAHTDPGAIEAVQPLRGLGETVLDLVAPAPYTQLQQSFDPNLPKGQRYYSKAHLLDELTDGAIEVFVDRVPSITGAFTATYLEPLGGAVAEVGPGDTAYRGRRSAYGFHALGGWVSEEEDEAVMGWVRGIFEAMAPHANGGVYVHLVAEDGDDRIPDAYGPNYERLRALKSEWDAANLFRHNHNIPPG